MAMEQAPQTLEEAMKAGGKRVVPQTLDEALKMGGRAGGNSEDTASILAAQRAKYPTAQEQGGVVGTPVEPKSVLSPDSSTVSRVASGVGRAVENLATAPYQLSHAVTHPMTDIVEPMQAEAGKASQELNAVHPSPVSAAGHMLASIIPGVGPWAANLGERAGGGDIAGAAAELGTMAAAPKVASKVAKATPDVAHSIANRTPVNTLKRAMPNIELEHLERAGHDLKAMEATTGVSNTDAHSMLINEEHAASALNDRVNKIVDPQRGVVVPGSRAKWVNEQIKNIPDYIRVSYPERYQEMVNGLNTQLQQPDLTIGDINDARVSLNKQLRAHYDAKLGTQLSEGEQVNKAMLEGQSRAAHALFDHGINDVGLGGANEARALNQRIGSLMKVHEGATGIMNASELESGTPAISRFGERLARAKDKALLRPGAFDRSLGVNSDIADAFAGWKGKPAEFDMTQSGAFARPGATPASGQQELLPMRPDMELGAGAANKPYQPGMAPMDQVTRRQQAGVSPTPEVRPVGEQGSLERGMAPEVMGISTGQTVDPKMSGMSPEGYDLQQHQRQLFDAGRPELANGQLDLIEKNKSGGGAMAPPSLFGDRVPEGGVSPATPNKSTARFRGVTQPSFFSFRKEVLAKHSATPGNIIRPAYEIINGTPESKVLKGRKDAAAIQDLVKSMKGGSSEAESSGSSDTPTTKKESGLSSKRNNSAQLLSVLDAVEKEQGSPGANVTMRELREKTGWSQEQLTEVVKEASARGKINVHPHDHGYALTPEERSSRSLVEMEDPSNFRGNGKNLYTAVSKKDK